MGYKGNGFYKTQSRWISGSYSGESGVTHVEPDDVKTWLGICRHKSHRGFGKRCKNLKHHNADTFHMGTGELINTIVDMLNGKYDQKTMERDFGHWMKKCKVSKFENTKFWNREVQNG